MASQINERFMEFSKADKRAKQCPRDKFKILKSDQLRREGGARESKKRTATESKLTSAVNQIIAKVKTGICQPSALTAAVAVEEYTHSAQALSRPLPL